MPQHTASHPIAPTYPVLKARPTSTHGHRPEPRPHQRSTKADTPHQQSQKKSHTPPKAERKPSTQPHQIGDRISLAKPNCPSRVLRGAPGVARGGSLVASIACRQTAAPGANPCAPPARVSRSLPVSIFAPTLHSRLASGCPSGSRHNPTLLFLDESSVGFQFRVCFSLCVPAGWLGCGSPAWGSVSFLLFSAFAGGCSHVCFCSFFRCRSCRCGSGCSGCSCPCGCCLCRCCFRCFGGCRCWGCLGGRCASSFPACSWCCSFRALGALLLLLVAGVGARLCPGLVGSFGALPAGAWVAAAWLFGFGAAAFGAVLVGGCFLLSCRRFACRAGVLCSSAWLVCLVRAVGSGGGFGCPFFLLFLFGQKSVYY